MTTEAMKSESATVLDFAGYQAKEGDAFDGLIKDYLLATLAREAACRTR